MVWAILAMRTRSACLLKMSSDTPQIKIGAVIKFAAKNWGAFDPENHVYVGLGIQGAMGTTPREIGERIDIPQDNADVAPDDLVVQVGAAINEFANNLASKNTDESKNHLDIRAIQKKIYLSLRCSPIRHAIYPVLFRPA